MRIWEIFLLLRITVRKSRSYSIRNPDSQKPPRQVPWSDFRLLVLALRCFAINIVRILKFASRTFCCSMRNVIQRPECYCTARGLHMAKISPAEPRLCQATLFFINVRNCSILLIIPFFNQWRTCWGSLGLATIKYASWHYTKPSYNFSGIQSKTSTWPNISYYRCY